MASLILYFSRAGENYVSGAIKILPKGNTQIAAEMIQRFTRGVLFKIEPLVPYSENYSECIEQAKNDQKMNARPELAAYPDSVAEFDTIYLGYPNYWGSMPMPVYTLLEKLDFSKKRIKPFCTHEGSGLGHSIEELRKICPKAEIGPGLSLQGGRIAGAEKEIKKWILK